MKVEDAARLLAPPGQLGRVEKEALWARISAAREPWWRRLEWRAGIGAVTAAVAIAAVILVVRPPATKVADEFTARGSASVPLALRCSPTREPGDCRVGDHLAFDFGTVLPAPYVALFAQAADGTVIWIAPADDTATVPLAEHASAGVLDTAAVIDTTYAPGHYQLFAVMSARPLTRADVRGFERDGQLQPPLGIHIETREFTVAPAELP